MNLSNLLCCFIFVLLLSGCEPFASTLYSGSQTGSGPANSGVYASGTVQPQGGLSQRGQYVWEKALQGLTMGGAIAGPYGAGGGLVIGLLAGLFTAGAQEAQVASQIHTEQAKDKDMEAKLDEELERQRNLEAQLGLVTGPTTTPQQTAPPGSAPKPTTVTGRTPVQKQPSIAVASVDKKPTVPILPAPSPFKNMEVRDINGDGIPDLWIYYNPLKAGEVVRQEEATHGDGNVDSWSYFKDGKLIRREVDTKGRGAADTVFYYDHDAIVREDRDESGSGQASYRVIYQNGRRAKVEEDTKRSGRMDHWIYYDPSRDGEITVKEEQDLNGDGTVDVWSYYENGRLVRRDVSAVGLDPLADKTQPPSMNAPVRPQLISDIKP